MTARYGLVGCGKSKKDGAHHARDLYDSAYFRLKREYVERYCDGYDILSAEYGVLAPTQKVSRYEACIHDLDEDGVERYRTGVRRHVERLVREGYAFEIDEVVVLAGESYVEPVEETLAELSEACEVYVRRPFERTDGIGEQMGWLREMCDAHDGEPTPPQGAEKPVGQTNLGAWGDA